MNKLSNTISLCCIILVVGFAIGFCLANGIADLHPMVCSYIRADGKVKYTQCLMHPHERQARSTLEQNPTETYILYETPAPEPTATHGDMTPTNEPYPGPRLR